MNKILQMFNPVIKVKECVINMLYRIKAYKRDTHNSKFQHAILIYRTARIGDFILFLHGATEILKEHADWKKILICHPCCEELARRLNLWDEVILFDYKRYKKSFRYQRQMEHWMSEIYVDKLLNMEYSRTLYSEIMIGRIHAKEKYSFDGPCFTTEYIRRKSNEQYTKLLLMEPEVMESKKNAQYAGWILGKMVEAKIYRFPQLTEYKSGEKAYYVISPGASHSEKMWPAGRFAEMVDLLWDEYKLPCILSGSANERYLAEEILKQVKKGKIVDRMGQTSLIENFELIRNAEFLVGNDSASVHIAASVNTLSFSITGGWDGERFLPYDVAEEDMLVAPVPIRVSMDCYGCCINGGINKSRPCGVIAEKKYQDDRKFKCIEAVSVGMVIEKIKGHVHV